MVGAFTLKYSTLLNGCIDRTADVRTAPLEGGRFGGTLPSYVVLCRLDSFTDSDALNPRQDWVSEFSGAHPSK